MSATDGPSPAPISPAELQEIVRVFADSDLRELRLTVGEVDLLVSRNEHIEMPAATTAPASSRPDHPVAGMSPGQSHDAVPAGSSSPREQEAADEPEPASTSRADLLEIRSPAIGTFYRRPAPDQPPFVDVGTKVAVGDAVGTIEVMKMFTTVTADVAGTVTEICVEDAELVEHGQPLFYLDPASS